MKLTEDQAREIVEEYGYTLKAFALSGAYQIVANAPCFAASWGLNLDELNARPFPDVALHDGLAEIENAAKTCMPSEVSELPEKWET